MLTYFSNWLLFKW